MFTHFDSRYHFEPLHSMNIFSLEGERTWLNNNKTKQELLKKSRTGWFSDDDSSSLEVEEQNISHSFAMNANKQKQFYFSCCCSFWKKWALHRNTLSIKSSVQWEQKKWEDARSHAWVRERVREEERERARDSNVDVGVCCNWRPPTRSFTKTVFAAEWKRR